MSWLKGIVPDAWNEATQGVKIPLTINGMFDDGTTDPDFAAHPQPVTAYQMYATVKPIGLYTSAGAKLPNLTIPATAFVAGSWSGFLEIQQMAPPLPPFTSSPTFGVMVGLWGTTIGGATNQCMWTPAHPLPVPGVRVWVENEKGEVQWEQTVTQAPGKAFHGKRSDVSYPWGSTYFS